MIRDPMDLGEALRLARHEIRQLEETVTALRDQLEVVRAESDSRVEAVRRESGDEIRQLRATVDRLREELERVDEAGRRRLEKAERENRLEIQQLQETIRVLRERLAENGKEAPR